MGQWASRALAKPAPSKMPAAAAAQRTASEAMRTTSIVPPEPKIPNMQESASQAKEIASHANIERMLLRTEISSQLDTVSRPAASPGMSQQLPSARIDEDQLQELLTLHSQDPGKWTAAVLADRFAVDEGCVANVVAFCVPFRVWQNDDGKMHARPLRDGVEEDSAR